jgi:hypothetical protein
LLRVGAGGFECAVAALICRPVTPSCVTPWQRLRGRKRACTRAASLSHAPTPTRARARARALRAQGELTISLAMDELIGELGANRVPRIWEARAWPSLRPLCARRSRRRAPRRPGRSVERARRRR